MSAPSSEDGHPVGTLHAGVYRARSVGRSRTPVAHSMVTAQGPAECRAATGGEAASEAACKPSSVPRKRGDGHPSRAPVTRRLLRPTRERGDAPLVRLTPHGLSYLALHQVELARFTRRRPEPPPTRLCGAGPRLSADGCYPLPCVVVLGLSSSGESPRRAQPSGHLAGEMTLAPAPRGNRPPGGQWPRQALRLSHPEGQPTAERAAVACRGGPDGSPPADRLLAGAKRPLGRSQWSMRSSPAVRWTPTWDRRPAQQGTRDTGLRHARRVRGRGPDQAR